MRRRHKAFVVVTDPTWREFKALAMRKGRTIEGELGRLVERELAADRRERAKSAARSAHFERELARLEDEG